MDHKIYLTILDGDVIVYQSEFENHKLATSEAIKKLFELNCESFISNAGEYRIECYKRDPKDYDFDKLDLTGLPIKDSVKYCGGKFRAHRIFPDLMNNFPLMCDLAKNNKYKFMFTVKML
ncbi:hypothetical protein [Niemeyer virus]|uniref:Uncharacterized protein n=1 Tax=Acanthamoeba polyphaga mimivirus Kroon TaxID=3069720 RepID=A0A0G2Y928_9VIRU|nr:hypothetical protein QJ850_gp352 [Acanthamoeba polyphaga mimivirus]AKI80347.1 hypothetical protein [Acanthamoeba polyphaga mimivirus Kroon]ALR84282.1 hypothetical protein [Niemeyer virus]